MLVSSSRVFHGVVDWLFEQSPVEDSLVLITLIVVDDDVMKLDDRIYIHYYHLLNHFLLNAHNHFDLIRRLIVSNNTNILLYTIEV